MDEPAEAHAQVLVIDDNDVVRSSITRLLSGAKLSVVSSPTAIGASRMMLRGQIKVVVVDLDMPEMRGTALVQLIRKNPRLSKAGVVIISGVSADILVTEAAEAGADAAVSKLDMTQTLVPTVTRLLRKLER